MTKKWNDYNFPDFVICTFTNQIAINIVIIFLYDSSYQRFKLSSNVHFTLAFAGIKT